MAKTAVITEEANVTTKNISKVVLLRLAQYPFLALSLMLIPRMMGPEAYGEYALLVSIFVLAASLVNFGGETKIFGKFIPEFKLRGESANISRLSCNILALKFAIDLIASIALFLILFFIYGDRFPVSYIFAIIAIMFAIDLGTVSYALVFGLNQLGKYALRLPLKRALGLFLVLILFHYYGLFGAIMATLVVEGFLTTLYFFWTRKYFHVKILRIEPSFLKPYLSFGFIFYLSWSLTNAWERLGNAMIEYITNDPRQVALFDIPNQIFLVVVAFILGSMDPLVPIFTELLVKRREQKLIKWSTLIIKYMGIVCTITFLVFVLAGPDLIPIIVGPEYQSIFPNGVILLISIFPMLFAELGGVLSVVYEKPGKYFQALCFAFAAFLVFSILLIPQYASIGCAIATLISYTTLAVVIHVNFRGKLLSCMGDGFKVIGLGSMFVPLFWFRTNPLANLVLVVCSVLGYLLLLFASRFLRFHEILEIYQAIRQPRELLSSSP